jgi:hypothetical protein
MVVFYKSSDDHVDLKIDRYNPAFMVEILKVSMRDPEHIDVLVATIQEQNWDLLYLIMMYDCPEEVIVDEDLRENCLKEVFGYETLSLEVIEQEIHYKHPNKHAS